MLAVDGTFVATVILAVAAIAALVISAITTRVSFNAERDALRASVRPIIVPALREPYVDDDDGFVVVPIRNVGPGVAAIRDVRIGDPGREGFGVSMSPVIPYDPDLDSALVNAPFIKHDGSKYFDETLVSVLIRYEDVGTQRFETSIVLWAQSNDRFMIADVQVYFCDKKWRRTEPPFVDSTLPEELKPRLPDPPTH
jgi:hypothetical protein